MKGFIVKGIRVEKGEKKTYYLQSAERHGFKMRIMSTLERTGAEIFTDREIAQRRASNENIRKSINHQFTSHPDFLMVEEVTIYEHNYCTFELEDGDGDAISGPSSFRFHTTYKIREADADSKQVAFNEERASEMHRLTREIKNLQAQLQSLKQTTFVEAK